MRYLILALLALSFNAQADDTGCDNWATMTQVLVARWQMDENFKDKTPDDVKDYLRASLGGHPEIATAEYYVDFAWVLKNKNVQDVYKITYDECSALKV
jgi:hypothetical protein